MDDSPPKPIREVFRRFKQLLVIIFVTWHLFFLFVTNAKLDGEWSAATVNRYEDYLGLDQGWGMFSSPVWKTTPFPALRLEFTDGSSDVMRCDNEPADIKNYFKTTRSRLRKFEEHLLGVSDGDYRRPMLVAYANWRVDEWQHRHPDDTRQVKQAVLLKRIYEVPGPDADRDVGREPTVEEVTVIEMLKS